MPIISDWGTQLSSAFTGIGAQLLAFLPKLLIAVIIFIAGWVVGSVLAEVVSKMVKALKIDSVLESAGARGLLEKAGFKLNTGAFIGGLIKWFIIVVFLVTALDILNLQQVNQFLMNVVLGYIPQVIVATLILIVAAVLADFTQKVTTGGARALESKSAGFVGGVARWAIWIVAILAALNQLGIASGMMQTLFTGLVAMLALAGGLAFGLGGKEAAARYIEKLREDISNK
jgi:small-conductance mechanosensitive channel